MIRMPIYARPELTKIDNPSIYGVERIMKENERLSPNMWVAKLLQRYGRGKGHYITRILVKNGNEYYHADIPTNANGIIPPMAMAERLLDIADGDRGKKQRNVFIDTAITALNTHEHKDKAKTYLWYLYPNEGDIKGIDDYNTKIVKILPKSSKQNRRSILLIGGTNEQRDRVARIIDNNFTIHEKRVLAGTMFVIEKIKGAAGTYQRARIIGEGGSVSVITLDPRYLNDAHDSEVTVHEAIHSLRDHDTKRLPELKRRGGTFVGKDSDLEESLTEAETNTREMPYKMHNAASLGAGYYPHVKKEENETTRDLVIQDRKLITEPKNEADYPYSGRKGKKAQRLLVKHYPHTRISKLKLRGNIEAIDTYWQTQNRDGQIVNMQAYNPKGTSVVRFPKGIKLTKFNDGKPRIVRKMPKSQSIKAGKQYYTKLKGGTAISRRPLRIRGTRR